jgi:outer membrane protein OmpA-like peptidoglycan-associated protein
MKNVSALLTALLAVYIHGYSQEVQWASKLIFQSGQYGEIDWSGYQALGEPDALPPGTLHKNGFRLGSIDGNGVLSVGYENPTYVSEILIVENHHPGRIVMVTLIDTMDNEYIVYQAPAQPLGEDHRHLHLKIPKTQYKVAGLSLHIEASPHAGWPQIDAVGLSESGFQGQPIQVSIHPSTLNLAYTPFGAVIPESDYGMGAEMEEEITFFAPREKLSGKINSVYQECKPVISPDGTRLYFVRRNNPANRGGKKDDQDIYYSDFHNGEWKEAVNAGKRINDRYPNGVCSVSLDGNSLLVINAYYENGIPESDGISISHKTKKGWSKPVYQAIDSFENYCDYQDYFLSNSGDVLLLAIQTSETQGDQDLYVSFRTAANRWSKPVNLGPTLNTSEVEFAPFLTSDDKTLYFSSNGHKGFGEADIFYSRRLDDTWLNWTEPQNVGDQVNTEYWDAYYTVSAKGDYAYFVSTAGPRPDAALNKVDEDLFRIPLTARIQPEILVSVTGKVMDSETNKPVVADIYYQNLESGLEEARTSSDAQSGNYEVTLPAGKRYEFRAEAEGYPAMVETLDLTGVLDQLEVSRNLALSPIKVGQVIALNNLFFVQSKAEILPESVTELERLYKVLMEVPTLEIELGGHTDNQGIYSANLKLSRERAEAVVQYLLDRGIEKRRLKAVGYGPTKPVSSNANPESRQHNRRVEVKILKN